MESIYFQFVNFIQQMHPMLFMTLWILVLVFTLTSVVNLFKKYNGEKKKFEKTSFLILAIILFALLIYLTYLRN